MVGWLVLIYLSTLPTTYIHAMPCQHNRVGTQKAPHHTTPHTYSTPYLPTFARLSYQGWGNHRILLCLQDRHCFILFYFILSYHLHRLRRKEGKKKANGGVKGGTNLGRWKGGAFGSDGVLVLFWAEGVLVWLCCWWYLQIFA